MRSEKNGVRKHVWRDMLVMKLGVPGNTRETRKSILDFLTVGIYRNNKP